MKINKHIFIGALLVLMMMGVISTVSATDSLNNDNLTADDAVSVDMGDSIYSSPSTTNELLGDGETTIYVDGSYDGDEQGTEDNPYKTISAAASAATGGETIFIKNGEYTESTISDVAKPLTFNGESQGGVIIKQGGTGTGFFSTTNMCTNLVFNNLYFKDFACTGANVVISIGGITEGSTNNVTINNCVFDNCGGRYGAVRIFAKFGDVTVDNCQFLNTKATDRKYSSAIYFGSAGPNTYTLKNTLINGSSMSGTTSTFGAVYIDRSATGVGPTILDNVTISDCTLTGANGLISTKGPTNISNSKFINNNVDVGSLDSGSLFWIQSGNIIPELNVETTIVVNNTGTKYLVGASGDKVAVEMNYNNIQNNTFGTKVAYSNSYNLDYNYWGSNDQPTGVTVNNWVIEDHGAFTLNDGSPLAKQIPTMDEPVIGDENTTFVSPDGDDNNTGSADSPVATIAKAVEIAKNRTGEIIIAEGTYTENNIVLDGDVAWSITGIGNVVIDGNASTNSIFKLGVNPSATFANLKFRNDKAKYGGAIYAAGNSQNDLSNLDVTIDHCTFEDMASSSRGGAIYLYYAKGNFLVNDSQFTNCSASSWGGAICVAYCAYTNALNLVIDGSTFEGCYANNGACGYLSADTITVTNSVFNNNSAKYDSAAMQFYNATGFIDNCIITNNVGLGDSSYSSPGVAIKITTATGKTPTVTITNSIIENNNNQVNTYPAIYVDRSVLDISYSSLVNDLSIETKDGTSSAVQGVATVNNNWWGTNDPSEKVKGNSITMDNWVIMNVVANVTEAIPGDKVALTVDFNHVNTTAGEIEELTGGAIPKAYKVQLSSNDGTIVPSTLTVKDGATKTAVYTVADLYDTVKVSSDEALVEMTFVPEVPPYYGIIYVSKDGNDDNNGSEDAPVATIAKAIELASRVGGSHQIVINEGTYKPGESLTITDDLTITGNGAVVIDADGLEKLIDLPYSSPVKGFTVVLNNLALINGVGNQYATVYNYADAYLFLNNVNISDCTGSYLGAIVTTTGNTTITDSVISDSTAGRIINVNVGYNKPITVTIINTTLRDNVAFIDDGSDIGQGYATIDVSTTTKGTVLNLIDSHIIGNTGKLGTVYTTSDKVSMNVNGTEFIDNTVLTGNGGAINGYTMTVNNSTFINNRATKDNVYGVATGGAINIGRWGTAVITNSKFVDNSATGNGNTIYNGWQLTINNCAIIDNTKGNVIYHNGEDYVMDAKYNWWGTNDDPSSLIGTGEYEDDYGYGYEDCQFDASKWVVMNVVNNLTSQDPLDINDTIVFTVDFTHYTDSTGTLYELTDKIPEVEVGADAIKGFFDKDSATTEGNVATFVYTADIGGADEINITSAKAVDTTVIDINEPIVVEVVYVSPNGDDNNVGYFDEPVATIAHAIEIAERGKIVIFEGTYTIDSTLVINSDLDIRGYEDDVVTIDGNLKRVFEAYANLNLTNIVFTNAKYSNGAVMSVESDVNVTIDGCTFYNNTATSTSGGQIVNNKKGNMTVNNSKFYENVASRGVVASQVGNLVVNNSEFYDNDMTGYTAYGIVYFTNTDVIVENTVFTNNKASNSAGIYANRANGKPQGSLRVINSTFKNNVANKGSGAAIYSATYVTVSVEDSTFINNTAVTSGSSGGNGGAVYSGGNSIVNIVDSVFIDNYAVDKNGLEDAGIYVYGSGTSSSTLSISNSVILPREGHTGVALYVCDGATATAENNFWGDNSKANTNANVEKWVIMSADYNQEESILTVAFNSTNSTDGTIAEYDGVLPDGFNVSVRSSSGGLDEILPVIAGQASVRYTAVVADTYIAVECADAEVIIPVVVEPHVIYVAVDGDDNNDGSKDAPVATIAKAIELADEGLVVIQEGTYTTADLGIISDDLNITGNGTVIIDAQNSDRILYVGSSASVVLKNLIMINGASLVDSGALLGNSNELTLINCTLSDSSAGKNNGGAIYNVGKLTIINSTFANNVAEVGGAIYNDLAELIIINSTFENNIANGDSDNHGGGAIFAQRMTGLSIDNSNFVENDVSGESSGGAIFISFADAEYTIANSRFISNHAEGKANTGGGAIYMVGTSNNERKGKLSISNTLFEDNTADTCGAAIYARATTVDVSNSVIFANKDPSGFAVYGYKTDMVSPAITLNDNWWGTNDDPKDFVGGNNNYKPTIARWAILTANNDTPFVEGNTVKITAELNKYTDGETIGTLATPITISRDVVIETTFDSIEGVMENGEFTVDYAVPSDLKLVAVNVDVQNIELFKVKTETVVEIENITAIKGDSVFINATVKTKEGYTVYVGEVAVYFGDDLVATIPVSEGSASQKVVIDKDAGVYDILAVYTDSTGDYETSEGNAVLNVTKMDANLNIADIAIDKLNNVEGNVTFTVTGENVNYTGEVPIEEGSATYIVPEALKVGTYDVLVNFEGNDYYYAEDISDTIVINKINTTLSAQDVSVVYRDPNGELVAVITDVDGNPLSVNLTVDFNKETYNLTSDSNGQISIPIGVMTPKTYVATISFGGDDIYAASSTTANVVVCKAGTCISAVDTVDELVATLTNEYGQALVTANVVVNVNGVDYALKTDSRGQAKFSKSDLEVGTYTANVSYAGNNKYNPSNASVVITVKSGTNLVAPDVHVVYREEEESGMLVATLTNAEGKALVTANVVVNLNGVDYALKTNSKGQVKVSTSDLLPKAYVATISYAGNSKYKPTSVTANVVVSKAATSISAIDNGEELVATLTNEYGQALVSANVMVNVNGVDYALKTNSKGQVKVSIADLDSKDYTATFSYAGNSKYYSAAVTINAAEGKTTTSISTVYSKETNELITTLTNTATGNGIKGAKVVVKINGVKNSLTMQETPNTQQQAKQKQSLLKTKDNTLRKLKNKLMMWMFKKSTSAHFLFFLRHNFDYLITYANLILIGCIFFMTIAASPNLNSSNNQ